MQPGSRCGQGLQECLVRFSAPVNIRCRVCTPAFGPKISNSQAMRSFWKLQFWNSAAQLFTKEGQHPKDSPVLDIWMTSPIYPIDRQMVFLMDCILPGQLCFRHHSWRAPGSEWCSWVACRKWSGQCLARVYYRHLEQCVYIHTVVSHS